MNFRHKLKWEEGTKIKEEDIKGEDDSADSVSKI